LAVANIYTARKMLSKYHSYFGGIKSITAFFSECHFGKKRETFAISLRFMGKVHESLLTGSGYDYPERMSMLHWPTPTGLLVAKNRFLQGREINPLLGTHSGVFLEDNFHQHD
jgi:hypothetical protein